MKPIINKRTFKHFKGCLIGGAIGDALGAAIEFMSMDQIKSKFGNHGLSTYSKAYGRLGAVDSNFLMKTSEPVFLTDWHWQTDLFSKNVRLFGNFFQD